MSMHERVKHRCSKLLHYAKLLSLVNVVTTSLSNNKVKCKLSSKIMNLYKNSLQIIRVYVQSVSRIHGHNGLYATPLADNSFNDQMIKQHALID